MWERPFGVQPEPRSLCPHQPLPLVPSLLEEKALQECLVKEEGSRGAELDVHWCWQSWTSDDPTTVANAPLGTALGCAEQTDGGEPTCSHWNNLNAFNTCYLLCWHTTHRVHIKCDEMKDGEKWFDGQFDLFLKGYILTQNLAGNRQ